MSRIYDALRKAERRAPGTGVDVGAAVPAPPVAGPLARGGEATPVSTPLDGRAMPAGVWELHEDLRVEYERIQVWLGNRSVQSAQSAQSAPAQTIMVASCQQGNGATTTAIGLVTTLAQRAAARVLIVDANLRTPRLDVVFAGRNGGGLSEWLDKPDANGGDIQPTRRPNLFVLTTGRIARSPLEIFSPVDLARLVAQLKARFHYVVFDAPPLLEFPDAYALVPHVDAVLLVVEADRTLVDDARRVMRDLDRAGAGAVGVVLNRQRDYTPRLLRRLLSRSSGARAG